MTEQATEQHSYPPGNGQSYRWSKAVDAFANVALAYGAILAWYLHAEPIAYGLIGAVGLFNLNGIKR